MMLHQITSRDSTISVFNSPRALKPYQKCPRYHCFKCISSIFCLLDSTLVCIWGTPKFWIATANLHPIIQLQQNLRSTICGISGLWKCLFKCPSLVNYAGVVHLCSISSMIQCFYLCLNCFSDGESWSLEHGAVFLLEKFGIFHKTVLTSITKY